MSQIKITIDGEDVSRFVYNLGEITEYNDESDYFAGVYRRNNFRVQLNNATGKFDLNGPFFQNQRQGKEVIVEYIYNKPNDEPVFLFQGYVEESTTTEDVENKVLDLSVLDILERFEKSVLTEEDKKQIDNTNGPEINTKFLEAFLDFVINKEGLRFDRDVQLTCESLFPSKDDYYSTENLNSLEAFNEFLRATNSYSVLERDKIVVLGRVNSDILLEAIEQAEMANNLIIETDALIKKNLIIKIENKDIIGIDNYLNGLNKIYNEIKIDETAYKDQASINEYGKRSLEISSYAVASQALADTYLDYYKAPKRQIDLILKMKPETLALKIGYPIEVDIKQEDLNLKGFVGKFFIISKSINFTNETITLKVREI